MAYLLILNGQRVDDFVELDPGATLTIGSGAANHIHLPEEHVAEMHGQVYPGQGAFWFQDLQQGYTCLNADPVAGTVHELHPNDVLTFGRTFLKFVLEPPARAGVVDTVWQNLLNLAEGRPLARAGANGGGKGHA